MKRAQLLGVAIAGVCGLGAFFGVMSLIGNKQTKVVREEVTTNTTQVLVAQERDWARPDRWPRELPLARLAPERRQPGLHPKEQPAERHRGAERSVARARRCCPASRLTTHKVVKVGEGGVLAAILPPGMRAISTRIKEETGVGRLILPNDRVDVILTRRMRGRSGGEDFASETLFHNVRVLAIGQLIEAKDGKKLAEGNTATLELTPAPGAAPGARQIRRGNLAVPAQHRRHGVKDGPAVTSAAIPSGYQEVRSEVASVWRQLSRECTSIRAGKKVGTPCE